MSPASLPLAGLLYEVGQFGQFSWNGYNGFMKYRRETQRLKPFPSALTSFTATQAKNAFGSLLEAALRGDRIFITKHRSPKAVLMSMEEFNSLSESSTADLQTLTEEFDAMLARMQAPKARAGLKAAFAASPKRLGKAAVRAARKRA